MPLKKSAALFSVLCVVAAAGISAYFNFTSRGYDWYYFDSLAVLIRSSVWHYGTLPIHDPWACSGTSVIANPQNWLFSPSVLFSLLLPANLGNWLSLIVFKALGFWGMLEFLRRQKVDDVFCWLAAAWFVNLNWFALHFAEGHVIYRGFYLLPWLLLFSDRLSSFRDYLKLVTLFCFLILDGGIYPAVFGFLFCVLRLAFDREQWAPYAKFIRGNFKLIIMSLFACGFVLAVKIVPLVMNADNLKDFQEHISLPFGWIMTVLFNMSLNNGDVVEGNLRFHELGNYLGVGVVVILFSLLIGREKLGRQGVVYACLAFLFAWISFGIGGLINPYTLLSNLPVLNKLHVQTRYGILFSLSIIFLVCFWANGKELKKMFYVLLMLVNVECLVANYFSYYPNGENYELPTIKRELWTKTIPEKHKPLIYYSNDEVSKSCYEPSQVRSFTKAVGEANYRGEVESSNSKFQVDMLVLTPGRIQFSYVTDGPTDLVLNHHYLEGWNVVGDRYEVHDADGRIGLHVPAGQGEVILKYRPPYLWWIVLSYLIGLGLFVALFRKAHDEL